MFTVYDKKKTEKTYVVTPSNGGFRKEFMDVPAETKVYSVRDDKSGYPQFLIYEDNQWKWVSAKRFQIYR
ncbi:MAG: hypothetical protein PUC73_12615 [Lachnospiraceae bacterium]|nr:hypothetical protein [Lachnospiraceae bacterium]